MQERGDQSVRIVRAEAQRAARETDGGRATAFNFTGEGGSRTWIGTVTLTQGGCTGGHHHGRHEVALYVISGRVELSWGANLAFRSEVGPGDFAYFSPGVPHQERNLSQTETAEFLVVRSDNERIAVPWED
jgi:uncharacterized RmlC-like cupin family protein